MRKQLLLLGSLMLAQQASGVTIINTDSSVSNAQTTIQHREAPPLPPGNQPEYEERERSAPPLPVASAGLAEGSHQWVDQDGEVIEETPRAKPPVPMTDANRDVQTKSESNTVPMERGRDEKKVSTSEEQDNQPGPPEPLPVVAHTIEKGWLSDSIDSLAYRAGYEMMWAVGRDGKADFEVHRDFTLSARTAQEALAQVVEPFPIRMCLFQVDKIAKVVPEDQECQ